MYITEHLKAEFQAKIDALYPKISRPEGRRRPGRAAQGAEYAAGRDDHLVHRPVELVSSADHVAPVQKSEPTKSRS